MWATKFHTPKNNRQDYSTVYIKLYIIIIINITTTTTINTNMKPYIIIITIIKTNMKLFSMGMSVFVRGRSQLHSHIPFRPPLLFMLASR